MIHIVTALHCEARPLIDSYRLRRVNDCKIFALYRNDDIFLIVSGIGKLAAATATGFLAARSADSATGGWLNIGIAGHPDLETGSVRLADRIIDHSSRQCWYPGLAGHATPAATLLTVDRVRDNFFMPACHDMEGSGFFSSAQRFAPTDNIQCLKIISDNQTQSHDRVTPEIASQLIAGQCHEIGNVIRQLQTHSVILRQQQAGTAELSLFLDHWHFTSTQQHQLQRLLQRWQVLRPAEPAFNTELKTAPSAGQVIASLLQRLDDTRIVFQD